MQKKTVLVGLSGGVDSSLCALFLKEQGYDVIGCTMSICGKEADSLLAKGKSCYGCGEQDNIDRVKVFAKEIGIRHIVVNCIDAYQKNVLDYFRKAYLSGQTPNPCVMCNALVKFGMMPELSGVSFDYFATGHYARIGYSDMYNRFVLRRGIDSKKDQSYFLYRLTQDQLSRTLLPLGGYTKTAVRALAKARGLAVHDRPDSQDFYAGDYNDLIKADPKPGNIVDLAGKVLGRHDGFWHYTVGQRRGLGISSAQPLYVLSVRPETNEVVVGSAQDLQTDTCRIFNTSFILPVPKIGDRFVAKIRSSQSDFEPVTIQEIQGDVPSRFTVQFDNFQKGVAPGQSLVLYQDDYVVGGGIITIK